MRFLHFNDEGKIDDFMVMVRPLSAATVLAARMGEQFDRISAEAVAAISVARARAGAAPESRAPGRERL